MRKQNVQPNRKYEREKKYSDNTSDFKITKANYKPRFIVKDPNKDNHGSVCHPHSQSHVINYNRVQYGCQSPVQYHRLTPACSDNCQNFDWRNKLNKVQKEKDQRKENFNEIIGLCTYILQDLEKHSRVTEDIDSGELYLRLRKTNYISQVLIDTFQFFQNNNP